MNSSNNNGAPAAGSSGQGSFKNIKPSNSNSTLLMDN
jgi:hypothetical protein